MRKVGLARSTGVAAGVLAAAFLGAGVASAEEPPAFRRGLWQFDRTVGGEKLQTKECISPSEESKRQNELLARRGCTFTPTKASGNVYTFSAECKIATPGAASVTARSTSTMTVESEDAYTMEITTTGAGTTTQEALVARRIGDCK